MKRTEIEKAIRDYEENRLSCVRDTGKFGKVLEVRTRDALMAHGIRVAEDVKARRLDRTDTLVYVNGKRVRIEVKSGAGAVGYRMGDGMGGYINPFTKADFVEEEVFPTADLIVWYPWGAQAIAHADPFKMGWVFTREEFLRMMERIGKKGFKSCLRVTKNGGQLNLQNLTVGMEDRLYDVLEELRTVRDLLEELGRG